MMRALATYACTLLIFGLSSSAAITQPLSAEEQLNARGKLQTAVALAEIAEAEQDGEAMLVAARLLSSLGTVAKRDQPEDGETVYYSVKELADMAKGFGADGDRAEALMSTPEEQRSICYWEFKCGTFDCDWIYNC